MARSIIFQLNCQLIFPWWRVVGLRSRLETVASLYHPENVGYRARKRQDSNAAVQSATCIGTLHVDMAFYISSNFFGCCAETAPCITLVVVGTKAT